MVLPLGCLNAVEYYNKPDNAWKDYYYAQAFPKSLPYKGEVMFLLIVDQCCKEDMVSEVFSKVLLESVMPSSKEIGKSALTTLFK